MARTVWSTKTPIKTAAHVIYYINRFFNAATLVKWMQHISGDSLQTDQNEVSDPLWEGY